MLALKKLFIPIFLWCFSAIAQDPINTQPQSAYSHLNPSFLAKDSADVLYFTHRNQWPKISGTYVTENLGYHKFINKLNGHLGLGLLHDNAGAGTLVTTALSLLYSQNITVNKVVIKAGVKGDYFQQTLDYSKLRFSDQIDQELGFIRVENTYNGKRTESYFNFSMGTSAFYKGFCFGVAVFNVFDPGATPENPIAIMPPRFAFQFSKTFSVPIKGKTFEITPYSIYQKQQDFDHTIIGVSNNYGVFILGFNYRLEDAVNTIVGIRTKYINILYSYDMTISKLAADSGGSHEMSIQLHPFKNRIKNKHKFIPIKSAFML